MKHALACLCFLAAVSLSAQEPLNTDTIIRLANAGIADDIILGMVNQQPGQYALAADDMIALKKAGVTDRVLAAMVVKNGAEHVPSAAPNTAARLKNTSEAAVEPPSFANDGRTRVFVTDSQTWQFRGGWNAADNDGGAVGSGYQSDAARTQTADVIKAFNQRCPQIVVTNNLQKAEYAVTFDRANGKISIGRHHKLVVFNRGGDDIFSDSTLELGNSAKDACEAILSHRPYHLLSSTASSAAPATPLPTPGLFDVTFTSVPVNAMVSIAGQPIGRTPFTTRLPQGIYKATFSENGYAATSKDVTVGSGYPTTVTTTLRTQ